MNRAAYMREWRKRTGRHKRPKNLDRSRPPLELLQIDPYAYNRRYMRWWRHEKAKENETVITAPIA